MKMRKFNSPMILAIQTGKEDVIGAGSGQSTNDGENGQAGDLILWTFDEWAEIYADKPSMNDLDGNGTPCERSDYDAWVKKYF